MKALVYHGPWDVQIDDKPQPTIQHPEDAILRITSTAILVLTFIFIMVQYQEYNQDKP
jgi:hypothetical protein